jgi:hypothetical protein
VSPSHFNEEKNMSEELVCHFGKHEGTPLSDMPGGYLRWAVAKIDPVPLPEYRNNEDGSPKTAEEVKEMEEKMRNFLSAAEDELDRRGPDV